MSGGRSRRRRTARGWCAAALLLAMAAPGAAWAHDPGLSSVTLRPTATGWELLAVFARADLEILSARDRGGSGGSPSSAGDVEGLRRVASRLFAIESAGGKARPTGPPAVRFDDSGAVHVRLVFAADGAEAPVFVSPRIGELGRGHRQFVVVQGGDDERRLEVLLDAGNDRIALPDTDTGGGSPGAFLGFVRLGVEHILIGYDHLAFLIALLLVGGTFVAAAKTISAFTVAHSITLALASLDLVRLPSGLVEATIAASIVYVGVENLRGEGTDRRWTIAFGFGLIHGFGFASVLRELTGAGGGIVAPLLGFNLGVELGQIAVAALVLPVVWHLHRERRFAERLAPACSALIVVAGAWWFLERTLLG